MSKELLPSELLQEILQETGALGQDKASRLVRSVQNFKPFRIKQKSQAEFNLNLFEPVFDQLVELTQKDWKTNFIEGCALSRREAAILGLKKYKFREESLCTQFSCEHVSEPFLAYFHPSAFYLILNQYLGGGQLKSDKALMPLTGIEFSVLERVSKSLCENITAAFQVLFPTVFQIKQVDTSQEDQKDLLKNDYLMLEILITVNETKYQYAIGVPLTYLKFIRKQSDQQDKTEQLKTDPLWEKVVTSTVMLSNLELKINVGEFTIPFEKSLNLQVGDVFPWEKYGPQVVVSFLDRPRLIGTLGAMGENYAIKIDEILS